LLVPVEPPVLGAGLGDLVVAPVEPDELPLPIEPDELPELPELPIEPDEELPLEDGLLVLPLEDESDLLKCLSHSAREIWPSLFASTDEKLGCELLALLPDEPPAALDDEPVDELPEADGEDELLPEADGEDDELLPEADGEAELPDDAFESALSPAALARDDRAKSTAAAVTDTVLSI
jgi:hypothetical protein